MMWVSMSEVKPYLYYPEVALFSRSSLDSPVLTGVLSGADVLLFISIVIV